MPTNIVSAASGDRIGARCVRIALLLVLVVGTTDAAAVVEFPAPNPEDLPGDALSSVPVRFHGQTLDHMVVGLGDGSVILLRYLETSRVFIHLQRIVLEGPVLDLAVWDGLPLLDSGVVAATGNPDQVVFLKVRPTPPYLEIVDRVALEEDPGTMAFVGNVDGGVGELAVSLPGIDAIVFLDEADGWRVADTMAAGDQPQSILGIDLDGDGIRELVTANRGVLSGNLGVYRTDGDGRRAMSLSDLPDMTPASLEMWDLDGDGSCELTVLDRDRPEVRFLSETDGILTETNRADLTLVAQTVTMGQLADATPALMTGNSQRGLVELFSLSGGVWTRLGSYFAGCRPVQCRALDMNGDGRPDLANMGGDGNVLTLLLGNDDPGFWSFPAIALNAQPGASVQADLDGDGWRDLVVASAVELAVSVFMGMPGGELSAAAVDYTLPFFAGQLTALQADGDVLPELAVVDVVASDIVVMDFAPDTGFSVRSRTDVGSYPSFVRPDDVDADGRQDLMVVTRSSQNIRVLFGDGDGGFDAQVIVPSNMEAMLAVDLNGDGRREIVATDGISRVWVHANLDGRTFGVPVWLRAGSGAWDLEAADLDGDLDEDVVVLNTTDHSLSFLENDGLGGLVRRIGGHALSGKPADIALADFDGDGRTDVAVNQAEDDQVALVLGVRDWEYSLPLELDGSPDMVDLDVVDHNADGVPDIMTLDRTLLLGLTMINVEQALVAVEPTALAIECRPGGLLIRILPDRPGTWRLEGEGAAGWYALAEAGVEIHGRLDPDQGAWVLDVDADDLPGGVLPQRVRLTVGVGGDTETLLGSVPGGCTDGPVPGDSALTWGRAPWPNPFNPSVQASFRLEHRTRVRAVVYDLAGRRQAVLRDGILGAGEHALTWNGQGPDGSVAAGVYLLRVETPERTLTGKLALLK